MGDGGFEPWNRAPFYARKTVLTVGGEMATDAVRKIYLADRATFPEKAREPFLYRWFSDDPKRKVGSAFLQARIYRTILVRARVTADRAQSNVERHKKPVSAATVTPAL